MEVGQCYLEGNADAVEFCPAQPYTSILAAATYTLQTGDEPTRTGSVCIFDVNAEASHLKMLHSYEMAGVFDIKWSPPGNETCPFLGIGCSDGHLRIHRLSGSSGSDEESLFKEIADERISSSMCLCLDWYPFAPSIAVGLSDGSISVTSFAESGMVKAGEWQAHGYEVWAASFDTHLLHLLYTGSDDCRFCGWDLRENPSRAVFQNSKVHKMGICCISKGPGDPYSVVTGSYDENLRVWDVRSLSKPISQTSICLGGGIWRIKHHPYASDVLLAACMHNGFAIVKIEERITLLETYNNHESLAYGADWQKNGSGNGSLVATCSFYDRLLRVWKPQAHIL